MFIHVFYLLNFPNVVQLSKSAAFFFVFSKKKNEKKKPGLRGSKKALSNKKTKKLKKISVIFCIYI
nr:MAG TPA: hypothetical protein [Caudoviricetes sp.]